MSRVPLRNSDFSSLIEHLDVLPIRFAADNVKRDWESTGGREDQEATFENAAGTRWLLWEEQGMGYSQRYQRARAKAHAVTRRCRRCQQHYETLEQDSDNLCLRCLH